MNTPRPPLATTLPPLQVPPEMAPQVPQTAAAPGPRRRAWLAAALAGALPPAWAQPAALPPHSPATRVALVIGNARYAAGALKNPGNDARLMQATAQALGFRVELLLDATQQQMLTALRTWLAASAEASTRLFYFAGHGAQYRGRNFLIPVDAELQSEDDIPAACIQANDLADRLSRFASGVNLVVLDACRSVPLVAPAPGSRPRSPNGMPPSAGLAELSAPRGTVVAFSTAPGAVASDNPGAANSAYTRHLAAQLRTPGLTIEAVFKRTRAAVLQESRGNQVPWEHSSLVGELCLAPERGAVCGAPAR